MLHDKRMEDFIFPYNAHIVIILALPMLMHYTKAILCLISYIAPHDLNIAHSLPYFLSGDYVENDVTLWRCYMVFVMCCCYYNGVWRKLFEIYGKFNE